MLTPPNRLLQWFKWTSLNVGLPFVAASLTFLLSYLTTVHESRVEHSFIRAFSGGDNLLIASIMFVALYYEADELRSSEAERWGMIHESLRLLMSAGCLLAATLFGAFKVVTFLPELTQGVLKESLAYSGALLSTAFLFAACCFATIGRAVLITLLSARPR